MICHAGVVLLLFGAAAGQSLVRADIGQNLEVTDITLGTDLTQEQIDEIARRFPRYPYPIRPISLNEVFITPFDCYNFTPCNDTVDAFYVCVSDGFVYRAPCVAQTRICTANPQIGTVDAYITGLPTGGLRNVTNAPNARSFFIQSCPSVPWQSNESCLLPNLQRRTLSALEDDGFHLRLLGTPAKPAKQSYSPADLAALRGAAAKKAVEAKKRTEANTSPPKKTFPFPSLPNMSLGLSSVVHWRPKNLWTPRTPGVKRIEQQPTAVGASVGQILPLYNLRMWVCEGAFLPNGTIVYNLYSTGSGTNSSGPISGVCDINMYQPVCANDCSMYMNECRAVQRICNNGQATDRLALIAQPLDPYCVGNVIDCCPQFPTIPFFRSIT